MAKFMLIGGGEVGRGNTSYETKIIDQEIVKMTKKNNPNFLFVGLASSFSDSYYDTMKKIYQELGCNCAYLKKKNILNNRNIVETKIKNADIIYFCGGDTIKLIEDIKNYNLISLLNEAVKNNTVIAGVSAGAILFCKEGYSDAKKLRGESDKFDFIEGLNLVNISFCPHYDNEERVLCLKEELQKKKTKVYCLENGTALKIEDDKRKIISSLKNKKAYLCYYQKDNFIQEEIN